MCMGPPSFGEELQKDLRVYPHVYGATLCGQENSVTMSGLSPCVWGHLLCVLIATCMVGTIHMIFGSLYVTLSLVMVLGESLLVYRTFSLLLCSCDMICDL